MQLTLFPPPPPKVAKQKRHIFTMGDWRTTRDHYTHGWLKGPQTAEKLGVPYDSFRKFVIRNPELKKRQKN